MLISVLIWLVFGAQHGKFPWIASTTGCCSKLKEEYSNFWNEQSQIKFPLFSGMQTECPSFFSTTIHLFFCCCVFHGSDPWFLLNVQNQLQTRFHNENKRHWELKTRPGCLDPPSGHGAFHGHGGSPWSLGGFWKRENPTTTWIFVGCSPISGKLQIWRGTANSSMSVGYFPWKIQGNSSMAVTK